MCIRDRYPGGKERLYRGVEYAAGAQDKPLLDVFSPAIRDTAYYNGWNQQDVYKRQGWIRVENALKAPINDRINAVLILMAQGRFQYVEGECESLVNALCTAVWDPKELTKNVRLDDGTSDIDSLDSFEYKMCIRDSSYILPKAET